MAAPYNLDADWAFIDGFETATLFRQTGENTYDSGVVIPHAVRVSARGTPAGDVRWNETRLGWLLCPSEASPAGQPAPKVDDRIADGAGVIWQADSATVHPLDSAYRMDCFAVRTNAS